MESKQYDNPALDKASWGEGPWLQEPDKAQFQDRVTGYPCLIVRNHGGALCGYVGVDSKHPLYQKGYGDAGDIRVHGGLTFAGPCRPDADEATSICHVPAAGETDDVWWFGFDCAHSWDVSPAYAALSPLFADGTYRNAGYVKRHIAKLALQLKDLETV